MQVAKEGSTYIVTVTYKDEDGSAVTPNSVIWTLTNGRGQVVNSRSAVSIASPGTSNTIVLQGDDLNIDDGEEREISISALYDSSNGSGLPLKDSATFVIEEV